MDFDAHAKNFDTIRRKERAKEIASCIRQYIDNRCQFAMEFGCGTGLIGLELIDLFSSITFIDASKGMIDEINRKISDIPSAEAVRIDLLNEKLPDKRFDFIFTSMVLHHIKNIEEILRVLYDLLVEDGKLIIIDLDKDDNGFHMSEPDFDGHNGFEQMQMSVLLNDTGFGKIEIKKFYESTKVIDGKPVPYSLFVAKAVKT